MLSAENIFGIKMKQNNSLQVEYTKINNIDNSNIIDQLKLIWEEVLNIPKNSIDTNLSFFELGGFSLLAIQMVERINLQLGCQAPSTAVLEHPTLSTLEKYLSTLPMGESSDVKTVELTAEIFQSPGDLGQDFPLTELQEAYWIGEKAIYQLDTPPRWYTEYDAENLDTVRFQQAIDRLIQIHPMLRAVFTDEARQIILSDVPAFPMSVKVIENNTDEEFISVLASEKQRVTQGCKSLNQWPLFDISLIISKGRPSRVLLGGRLIIMDGRSGEIFARDLLRLYEGREVLSPTISFPAYIHYLNETLPSNDEMSKASIEVSRDYWMNRIQDLPSAPRLPPRSSKEISPGPMKRRAYRLSKSTWQKFQNQARSFGVTPTIALCGAYAWILSKWNTSGDDFTLNMMYGKRENIHPQVNDVIGNFSDTLLLAFYKEDTFTGSLKKLQKQLFKDLEYGNFPGTSVIRELSRHHGAGKNAPLMPYVFASGLGLEQGESEENSDSFFMEKFGWTPVASSIQTPQVLLDHQVVESRGELVLQWDSRDEAFPDGMIDVMFNAYVSLLQSLTDDGNETWLHPEIGLKEVKSIREKVNSHAGPSTRHQLLHQGFKDQVRNNPERIALVHSNGEMTYSELNDSVMRVSQSLQLRNIKPGEPVVIHLPKGCDQVISCLGILMAGGAYVPIAYDQPESRISSILESCKPRFVIADATTSSHQAYVINDIEIIDQTIIKNNEITQDIIEISVPSQLAYIIFTSGSTGTPKGVAITHEAAMNTILDVNNRFNINSDDRVLAVSELNFDLSVYDLFGMFSAGGSVVIPDHVNARNPIHLASMVEEHGVTVWNSVPAYVEMITEYVSMRSLNSLVTLKKIMMSGDWISLNLPAKIKAVAPEARMISMGGATEASIWSNFYEFTQVDPVWDSIPYGSPLSGQSFHVLDTTMNDCPDWVPGELFIGGFGLAIGYHGDQERTDAQFVIHPVTGERLYRTGDWGRYLPGAILEFLGRRDGQVKIRGHRIELGEIESTLMRIKSLKDVVVIAKGEKNNKSLMAFIVPFEESDDLITTVRNAAEKNLPSYMIPSQFYLLESLPLTANGKIDRRSLSEMKTVSQTNDAIAIEREAEGEWELLIHDIWAELLDHDPIPIDKGFFDVGGNSITAIRMIARLQKKTTMTLPLDIVHRNPSISELAEKISSNTESPAVLAVSLGGKDNLPKLFCPHPVGGNVFCYWDPQRKLKYSLVGLQSRGLANNWSSQENISEMAEVYLESIRPMLPEDGLINFLGWSMGGMISLEMARLLEAENRRCRVVLLDTWVSRQNGKDVVESENISSFFHDISGGRIPDIDDQLSDMSVEDAIHNGTKCLNDAGVIGEEMDENVLGNLYEVFRANSKAIHFHAGGKISSEVLLFQSSIQDHKRFNDLRPLAEDPHWVSLLPSLKIISFEGDHFQIIGGEAFTSLSDQISTFYERGFE